MRKRGTERPDVLLVFVPAAGAGFLELPDGRPMNLLFTSSEVVTVELAVLIVSPVAVDGESNWMEGVLLLAVY